MIKAHQIRLHPTPEQEIYFAKAAGTARFCFTWARAEWERQYQAGEKPSALSLRTQFHAIRKDQFPWTYEVTKCAIEGAFMDVGAAFRNFLPGAQSRPQDRLSQVQKQKTFKAVILSLERQVHRRRSLDARPQTWAGQYGGVLALLRQDSLSSHLENGFLVVYLDHGRNAG